jgi:transposase
MEDETILRLYPVLRRAWSLRGRQATVGITGRNARRVLFGTINVRTGHRITMLATKMSAGGFQEFLCLLHRHYPGRPIYLLLDKGSTHISPHSQALAKELNIELVWLPTQCPELNSMDHLFKEVKSHVSANHQYQSIEEHAQAAEKYLLHFTNREALKKAGIQSKNFWLKSFFK